jgi:hypothetical protein
MSQVVNITAFATLSGLWLAFAVALVAARSSLDATWDGVAAFPFMPVGWGVKGGTE